MTSRPEVTATASPHIPPQLFSSIRVPPDKHTAQERGTEPVFEVICHEIGCNWCLPGTAAGRFGHCRVLSSATDCRRWASSTPTRSRPHPSTAVSTATTRSRPHPSTPVNRASTQPPATSAPASPPDRHRVVGASGRRTNAALHQPGCKCRKPRKPGKEGPCCLG
jgi:hypothetical protein